jgi:AcrR family transcriptional regulator
MTVYHQFKSKAGLIEAVFDSLAIVRVGVPRLVAALALEDPLETLDTFIATFAAVWEVDRTVIRRLQGLAAVDRDLARTWRRREARRREGFRAIVSRVVRGRAGPLHRRDVDARTDVLFALIAFETFDVMAGSARPFGRVAPTIHRLAVDILQGPRAALHDGRS